MLSLRDVFHGRFAHDLLFARTEGLWDPHVGLLNGLRIEREHHFGTPLYNATLKARFLDATLPAPRQLLAQGSGRTPLQAARRALGEALERSGASGYDLPRDDFVFGSHDGLAGKFALVDPTTWPHWPADVGRARGYGPVACATPLWWCRMSTAGAAPSEIWVPCQWVLFPYFYDAGAGEVPIAVGTSTGLASGPSLAHACVSALLELVERDAFTLAWLIQPDASAQPNLPLACAGDLGERCAALNADITLKDVTTDAGIPVVAAFFQGRLRPCFPHLCVGAAARLTRRAAAERALEELAGCVAFGFHAAARMPAIRPEDINEFSDHARHWAHTPCPEALVRWIGDAPVTKGRRAEGYEGLPPSEPPSDLGTPADIFQGLCAGLQAKGIRVLWRDLTPAPFRERGIFVVRVTSPDLQPLHVGHGTAAVRSARLERAWTRLRGEPFSPDRPDTFNGLPHPFP